MHLLKQNWNKTCHKLKCTLLTAIMAAGIVNASQSLNIPVSGQGGTRHLNYYVPDGINHPPLVLVLHGAQGNGNNLAEGWGWDKIADREKFVVATPSSNGSFWNIWGPEDVDFILAVIDTMANRYNIDHNRVYATGWSMGGMMSYWLACRAADKFAAIGPSSGYPHRGEGDCTWTNYVPVYHIHGVLDDFVPYKNDTYSVSGYLYSKRINNYGCPTTPDSSTAGTNGGTTLKEYWGPCEKDAKSEIYLESWMKHHYYDNRESEVIWNFFKNHDLSETVIPGIVFYQYKNFDGRISRMVKGDYPHSLFNAAGIPDSAVSSMRVEGNLKIEFFDNDNFKTPIATLASNDADLSGIKNRITAIRISDAKSCSLTITPYLQIDGGEWQTSTYASVTEGQNVIISPKSENGGSWNWSGPNGYSASTREVTISNISTLQLGSYIATYTNLSGCKSIKTFTISDKTTSVGQSRDHSGVRKTYSIETVSQGLYLNLNGFNGAAIVSMYDIKGSSVYKNVCSKNKMLIPGLTNGVYLINIKQGNTQLNGTFVVR